MPDRYFGKYTGIVKDNRDGQKLGQLKVSVPSLFPPEELMTARPGLPFGVFFVPENENKVWIEFEGGDPGLPLWTGVQYVAGEWAAEAAADPPERRVIRTPAGHFIRFVDSGDQEVVEISSPTRIVIKSAGLIEIEAPNVIINGRVVAPQPRPI